MKSYDVMVNQMARLVNRGKKKVIEALEVVKKRNRLNDNQGEILLQEYSKIGHQVLASQN